jgi:hypothetical protein
LGHAADGYVVLGSVLAVDLVGPFFLFDRGEVDVLGSIEEVLGFVEPWDVTDSLEVFDSRGVRIGLRAEGVQRTKFTVGGGRTELDPSSPWPSDPDVLAGRLRAFAQAVGPERLQCDVETSTLDDLVRVVSKFFGLSLGTDT